MPTTRPTRLSPRTADPRRLYEAAVQCPEAEIDFVDSTFRKITGRRAALLREDFCGTAATACEWVRRRPTNHAIGVDLDPSALAWSKANHVAGLTDDQRRRLRLKKGDVRTPTKAEQGVDIVLAMNFSYWCFTTRESLVAYFRTVRKSLAKGGVFFLDFFGGWEAQKILTERKRCKGFTYIWEHAHYNPITADMTCHIHFEFPGGGSIRKAFTYHWRLWTLPEVRELLVEAGFRDVTVYWEGDDGKGGGDGVFRPNTKGEVCASWIAYLSAR